MENHRTLIDSLEDPALYEHSTDDITVRETHISSIVLTGPYAYKIKKPVEFDFLDFTSPKKRRHFCRRELELNRRLCPVLYRSIVEITGSPEDPALDGNGSIFDYAVKMVQFEEDNLLSRRAQSDKLRGETVDEVVKTLANFHDDIETIAPDDAPFPEELQEEVRENFRALENADFGDEDRSRLSTLQNWSEHQFEVLSDGLQARLEDGFVRNCHGDVHLGNIVRHEGTVKIFDCIEFNDEFRFIDVMNELGFLTMDLHHQNYSELARWAVNLYVTRTGDHAGLKFLNYFQSYRAMVRAKVNHLDPQSDRTETLNHIRTAHHFTEKIPDGILITHGFSGTGKTTQTDSLIRRYGAIRIRSDVERKRLAGIPFREEPDPDETDELYSPTMTEQTYDELLNRGRTILEGGYPVVVDATFLKEKYRNKFRRLACELNVPFGILKFDLPEDTIRNHLREREKAESISDAGVEVFEEQQTLVEPVQTEEAPLVLSVGENGIGEQHYRTIRDFLGDETFRPKKTGNE